MQDLALKYVPAPKFVELVLVMWFGIGIFLAYISYWYDLDSHKCNLCNQFANTFPFIDIAAAKSDFPNVMRINWLYLSVTTPMSFLVFFMLIPRYKTPNPSFLFIYIAIFFSILLSFDVMYLLDGGPDITKHAAKWDKLFIHTIFGGYIISFCAFFFLSFGLHISIFIPVSLLLNR